MTAATATTDAWLTSIRATPSTLRQWWVLTVRLIVPSVTTGEILTAILAPATFTISFYIPLNRVMTFSGTGFSSYAQFMAPIVILQAAAFTAISAAFRAATDMVSGLDRRFDQLLHHNFVFSRDPHAEFEAIYRRGEPAADPTCYICAPARTEPDVAPPGGEVDLHHPPHVVVLERAVRAQGAFDLADGVEAFGGQRAEEARR